MFLPGWPPFSVYRGHKQLDNSFCVCAQMELGVKNKATVIQSSFGARALQITPALCLECRSALCPCTQLGELRGQPRGSCAAQLSLPPDLTFWQPEQKTRGHGLSDTAIANSTPPCTQLCFCTREHLFSGADVSLSLHAASWEPCMPEENSESSIRSSQHASPLCWCFQPNIWKSDL